MRNCSKFFQQEESGIRYTKKTDMKKRMQLAALAVFTLLILSACNQKYESTVETMAITEMDAAAAPLEKETTDQPSVERKIIKEGTIRFETGNALETRKRITESVATYKGYLAQDNTETYGGSTVHTLTLRIPSENFETVLNSIADQATKVDNKDIKALDVTEEFIDVESRIQTKKELETRYKALLTKANKIEEILAIEKEIEALRSDIESFEGRLNYLKSRVSYSTLTTVFYEQNERTPSLGSEFTTAFSQGWSNLVSFILGLFYIWPFILLTIGVLYLVRRIIKRRKQKKS